MRAPVCILALAANSSDTNNLKLIGGIATLACESTDVDRDQCPKTAGQRKNKRCKHSNSNVVKLDHSMDTVPNNSVPIWNPSGCATHNVKSWQISKIPKKKRSKRKRRKSMESNKAAEQSETAKLPICGPVDKDLPSPLSVNSFPKEDSEVKNNVGGLSLCGDRNETAREHNRLTLAQSADISDLEARYYIPTLNVTTICSPLKSAGEPVPAVDIKVATSLMENRDVKGSTNVLSEMKLHKMDQRTYPIREGFKTYSRKRQKVCDSPVLGSKYVQKDTGDSMLFVQDRMANTSLDHSVETLSGGCAEDLIEKKLVEGQESRLQAVEDILLEKVVDGCADVKRLVMENEKCMGRDIAKEKPSSEGFLNEDTPLVDSWKQNFEQYERAKQDHVMDMQDDSTISHMCKEFDDECGKIVPYESVGNHSIPSLSDLSNSRDGTQVDEVVNISLERSLIGSSRKKLLVLDINGLLADIVRDVPNRYTPEAIISGKAVFKRPYCDDFLQFCFTRFSVGVWSSRMKRNVELTLDFLMGDAKKKLLFCWDQWHCTETGFNTVENREKPLLVKKLKKLWGKCEPNLPWERGDYNETNTLLLDDSPYKALGNPPYTAIFPHTYRYTDEKDNSLGPGGDLRLYLEGLANAENVQKYVEENPFGQRPITEKNLSWRFYCKVIESISSASRDTPDRYSRVNLQWRKNR